MKAILCPEFQLWDFKDTQASAPKTDGDCQLRVSERELFHFQPEASSRMPLARPPFPSLPLPDPGPPCGLVKAYPNTDIIERGASVSLMRVVERRRTRGSVGLVANERLAVSVMMLENLLING